MGAGQVPKAQFKAPFEQYVFALLLLVCICQQYKENLDIPQKWQYCHWSSNEYFPEKQHYMSIV